MYKFKIRSAGLADMDAIYKINQNVLGSGIPYSVLKNVYRRILMDTEQTVYVITHSNNVVGYIHAGLVHNFVEEVYTGIFSMGVYDYFCRRGGGSLLLNTVCKWSVQMFSQRIKVIPVSCSESCDCGGFFDKNGFCRGSCGILEKNLDMKGNYCYERMYT